MDVLQAGICYRGTDGQVAQFPKNYLFYAEGKRGVKQNYCDSDTYLFNLGPNDAVELRAFLFSTQAFNGFYTGYGFTANFYQEPMVRSEYNSQLCILVMKFQAFFKNTGPRVLGEQRAVLQD